MSADTIQIRLKINFTTILLVVLFLHAFFLLTNGLPTLAKLMPPAEARKPLIIRDIRTVGAKDSKIQNSAYLSKSLLPSNEISKTKTGAQASPRIAKPTQNKQPLSLSDLSMDRKVVEKPVKEASSEKSQRPGTRPVVAQEKTKALSAISLKGSQIKEFAQQSGSVASSASQLSGDPRTRSLNNSDILVNLEVPEGVHPDELNKYELMFYGFQRRTAINYVNAFYKNLDKFQRENPHMQFPMTETKQVMTGRLTYDEKGNIKQIKMIRWTNVDRLQQFFEDVLKDMDTLHNPPKPLWSKTGEFSIFFSLVING